MTHDNDNNISNTSYFTFMMAYIIWFIVIGMYGATFLYTLYGVQNIHNNIETAFGKIALSIYLLLAYTLFYPLTIVITMNVVKSIIDDLR